MSMHSLARVATPDLIRILEAVLSNYFGTHCPIVTVARRPSPYQSSFPLHEVDATLENGTVLALVVKDLGWHALSPDGQRAKPRMLHDACRETAVGSRNEVRPTVPTFDVPPEPSDS